MSDLRGQFQTSSDTEMLKDMEFPASKDKIIDYIKQQSGNQDKEEILRKLEQLDDQREYRTYQILRQLQVWYISIPLSTTFFR